MSILEGLRGPGDVKNLGMDRAIELAREVRRVIVDTVAVNGGHLASNLGVVELTIALHRVFSTPADSIVWDVGHQCYAHKLLTGRLDGFQTIRRAGGLSGFPKRSESPHDAFDTGHASTSVSAALGLLAADRARGGTASVVAVIGDGALTGGMAYEAMSHAGQLGLPLIVVLNDNSMSISPNVGAVSRYLTRLTTTARYQKLRRLADRAMLAIPVAGKPLFRAVMRAKKSVKAFFFKESLFSDLGFEYAGPIDGHNLPVLCEVLAQVKELGKPVVVHLTTKKGKGHTQAEDDPTAWHGVAPARRSNGGSPRPTFTQAFGAAMLDLAEREPDLVAVTAAMAEGTGLSAFQKRWPARLYDVGIAEAHAVTFAAGLAAGGQKPVVAIYSTFMQRCVDQVHHDVALENLPVVFALDRSGAVPDDGETHQGLYDIQIFRGVPGLAIAAPASAGELAAFLSWALHRGAPTLIRFPKGECPPETPAYAAPVDEGRGVAVGHAGGGGRAHLLLVSSGALVDECIRAAALLAERGVRADVFHLRFLKPLDLDGFLAQAAGRAAVLIAEEGVLTGSVAMDLAALARQRLGLQAVAALGFDERPLAQDGRAGLLSKAGLDAAGIARRAAGLMGIQAEED
ncbi:MAG: 1-deoxy-D-xylulose-5-phosphate synthase [Spirochaetia bacterium]|nr:1-deoxy-D-xylulose-5-phosphate synthase [Spirochaetia bacterium]